MPLISFLMPVPLWKCNCN